MLALNPLAGFLFSQKMFVPFKLDGVGMYSENAQELYGMYLTFMLSLCNNKYTIYINKIY